MRWWLAAYALVALAAAPPAAAQDGAQHLSYHFGPIAVRPGQNRIVTRANPLKPPVDGYITGITPNLVRTDGSIPHVTDIHLHHGVWLVNGRPQFASGEEKTILRPPPGFGLLHRTSDRWDLNYMIHNLTPIPDTVFLTYEIDFVPLSSPAAATIRPVQTLWIDVTGGLAYPVFDALRGTGGRDRRLTYPDEQPDLPRARKRRNQWLISEDGALVGAYGHLHPGGLWTELQLTRNGRTVRLFRSDARYFDPRGPISWDLAMTATPPDWRVQVRRGDVLSVSATYDTRRASWYESMGIMPVLFDPGGSGADPFTTAVDRPGDVTHGRLAENIDRGGKRSGLADPRRLPSAARPQAPRVAISGFQYARGDLSRRRGLPTIEAGRSLTFVNRDARRDIFHTITSCRAPCNRSGGIGYPLADGPVTFDSGQLGFGPVGASPAANRVTWSTPRTLRPGTYTYFCRVHPFMRGALRVTAR
jgi:plastocyanin